MGQLHDSFIVAAGRDGLWIFQTSFFYAPPAALGAALADAELALAVRDRVSVAKKADDAKAAGLVDAMKARGAEVPIPVDVVCAKEFKADAPATVKAAKDVAADDLILDIGPKTAAQLAAQLNAAGTIVGMTTYTGTVMCLPPKTACQFSISLTTMSSAAWASGSLPASARAVRRSR